VELCPNDTGTRERISPDYVLEFGREILKCVECTREVCFGKFPLRRHSPLEQTFTLSRRIRLGF
jgi:hypothetical protein